MLKRLSIAEFLGALIDAVEARTGLRCYSDPNGEKSPFFCAEVLGTEPANTKTMFVDRFDVRFHCISEAVVPYSKAPAFRRVQALEEALTEDLALPEPFYMHRQESMGLQTMKKDETGEGHAVLEYSFHVCYGLICK